MKIFIDNGHGLMTAGKRSPDGQFREAFYNREIAKRVVADQSNSSAELQRRCSFPFGSLRVSRVPLGSSATSRTPLAAIAARGAVDNINDDVKMLIIYCSYPAFFLKSLVCAQHFYNLMCEILL